MNIQIPNGDIIENLPTDSSIPSHSEIKIVDTLFKEHQSTFRKVLNHSKDLLLVALLFVIFSLPVLDALIGKVWPLAGNSTYVMVGFKTLFFVLFYFILMNINLIKK